MHVNVDLLRIETSSFTSVNAVHQDHRLFWSFRCIRWSGLCGRKVKDNDNADQAGKW